MERHETSTSVPSDWTTLYDAYGASHGAIEVNGMQQSQLVNHDSVGFGGQWGYYTENETAPVNTTTPIIRAPLVLCGLRYYDPIAARFLTRDPIGYEGGINLYTFCGNNPVNRVDPSGLDFVDTIEQLEGVLQSAPPPVQVGAKIGAEIALGIAASYKLGEKLGELWYNHNHPAPKPSPKPSTSGGGARRGGRGGKPQGGTYKLVDPNNNNKVMRTGRSKDLKVRKSAHDLKFPGLKFEIDMLTDDYAAQRGREQIIHVLFNPLLNFRRPIAPRNPFYEQFMKAGRNLK